MKTRAMHLRPFMVAVLSAVAFSCTRDEPEATQNGTSGVAEQASSSSSTTAEPTESSSESESESSSSSTTVGPIDCQDVACSEPGAAFCANTGECVPCHEATTPDDACRELGLGIDVCNDAGTCVTCTHENLTACIDRTPLCNVETFVCERCDWHEQCPAADPSPTSAGCNLETGACLPTKSVITVDGDAGSGADFSSLSAAIASVEAGTETTIIVHALDNDDPYLGGLTLTGPRTIALLAAPDEAPIIQGTAGNPGLSLSGGATVFVQGLRITGNTNGIGVRVEGPETLAFIDRTHVVLNTGGGIEVHGGAMLTLRNSFVQGPNNGHAAAVIASTLTVIDSTLGGNFGNSDALTCDATSTATVRNSVVVSQGTAAALDCTVATVTTSFVADSTTTPPFDAAWFENYDNGDFHLSPMQPFTDVAVWLDGDPTVDIDGEPRPNLDESRDVAGADVLTP